METKPQNQADSQLHFLDYWRIIRIRKLIILSVFLLVVLTTTGVTLLLPKSYMSTVRIDVTKDASDISPLGYSQTVTQYDPYFMTTEFEKLRSRKILYRVIEELGLTKVYGDRLADGQPLTTVEAYEVLKAQIDVTQTRNTSLIQIQVYSDAKEGPAEEARDIANKLAEVYTETRLELQQERAQRGIDALKDELLNQDIKVKEAQARVDELKEKFNISDALIDGARAALLEPETVRSFERERITAQTNYEQLATFLSELLAIKEQGNRKLREAINSAEYDPELGKLMQDLYTTETKLAQLRVNVGPANAEYKAVAAMQSELDRMVDSKVEGILNGWRVRVAAAKAQLDKLTEAVESAKAKDVEVTVQYRDYLLAKRDLENQQKIRDAIYLRALQETVDLQIPKQSIVEITDPAELGLKPVRPNVPLNIALGIIVGLIVGVGLAFFIEYLDTSVKTIDDVERALESPVLGVIPQNVGSLLEEGADSPHAEAYRVLRTNIIFSRKNDNARCLTVVSGGAGEGKSTTICNLATIFAHHDQRVLLVDSDLRRPSLHKILKVSNSIGLTNCLLGQKTMEEAIQTTKVPNLDFLPSGKLPSSSLGILNSPQMKKFVEDVKSRYDFVFFDSPPIMGISDASVLTSMVDLTLLVVQYRKYPQMMTQRAKQMVEKVGGRLLGVVLNNINISQDSYYYYYSGYYYDYYSRHEDQEPGQSGKNGDGDKEKADSGARATEGRVKQRF